MRVGCFSGAVILLVLSLGCIVVAVVDVVLGKYGMGSVNFWGAVGFHLTTAIIAAFLLDQAHRVDLESKKEEPL